ncbi:BRO1-domain-containing protein [Artomyces pyxidatus]|uniref:BRO1-domain-containing protein n=1 Tax=Artomyces pyxidatus TaxID=48021 RepID=A0ACB8T7G0_9AGAM|nr:BRO1-domain-containing protein [Artomyces pyxidatus]
MSAQSPMISIPKKGTDEVDWTTPIRTAISQSYGEDPDNYSAEYASLQRCRQDAVRGAGSDMTARDLLYKYFGQLELLELRFPEIRVNFPWRDAFTLKLIVQTSLAYEKASVIFQIASTHAAIASSQSRSDPEGVKRAFYYFRCCAGMLTYINENFLHAPSTDLSREVVKFLVGVILAQATEVFWEKCRDEKKGNALVAKIAAQAASMYSTLNEEVKEFMGKGIFDRNWVTVIQIKSKYFASLTQYYRGLADHAASKHGEALVRFQLAETLSKEAHRTASTFNSMFLPQMSPNLPADAGQSLFDLTKVHAALCADRRAEGQRDNDLIYNAVLPVAETLAPVDKAVVATPIPIQEVYGTPEVQKVIGADLFVRLIPLSVHESASVYSEEKAKLVRGEVEKAESAAVEASSALDALGVKAGLPRYRAMVEGGVAGEDEIPSEVRRWREDIGLIEEREGVDALLEKLGTVKDGVRSELDEVGRDLEIESRDCEAMRVKFDHLFTQEPSSGLTKGLRGDLKDHMQALHAAAASDEQVRALWESVKGDVRLLISDEVEGVFRDSARGHDRRESLLDLDMEKDDGEKAKIAGLVQEIEERLGRLNKIERERDQTLKDLKEKIQTDDVSNLLLLNRRNPNVEPTIFAAELEKFRPFQQRLSQTVHHQQIALQEMSQLWKSLKDLAGRGEGARKWDERERRKKESVRRFNRARDGYMDVRDGLAKGLQFYSELTALTATLRQNVKDFVNSRTKERQTLASQAETQQRLSAPTSPPPKPPPPPSSSLDRSFASMSINNGPTSPPLPPPPNSWSSPPPQSVYGQYGVPPPPAQHYPSSPPSATQNKSYPPAPSQSPYGLPPPPKQPTYSQPSSQSPYPSAPPNTRSPYATAPVPPRDPYAALGSLSSFGSPAPPPPPQQRQASYPPPGQSPFPPSGQSSYPPPGPSPYATQGQSYPSAPPSGQPSSPYDYRPPVRQGSAGSPFPPPPPPVAYGGQQPQQPYGAPAGYQGYGSQPQPPPQQGQQQQQPQQYGGYGQYGR